MIRAEAEGGILTRAWASLTNVSDRETCLSCQGWRPRFVSTTKRGFMRAADRTVYRLHRRHSLLGLMYGRRATDDGFHGVAVITGVLSAFLLLGTM
jgi:hypothetical protein